MREILQQVKCFLLDMDGTIYLDNEVIDGAIDAVNRMREKGRVIFLTNNSSSSRDAYVTRLNKLGFNATDDEVFTSGNATVEYLKAHYEGKRIYLFGTKSLHREFIASGITPVDDNPDLIVLGFHTEFDYNELEILCNFIREGVPYIATHPDINCPTARGYKPDVGAFIALIEKSTGVLPTLVCGKPNRPIGESVERLLGLKSHEIAMVGDRLSTDIRFAYNNGFVSIFVLSGEGTLAEAQKMERMPDVVLPTIAHWDE